MTAARDMRYGPQYCDWCRRRRRTRTWHLEGGFVALCRECDAAAISALARVRVRVECSKRGRK